MRVLITGGAGYIGSVLARQLLARGHHVRVIDRLLHGGASLLGLYPEDAFDFVHADVRDAEAMDRSLDGMDAVVHLAAIVGDPACARDPQTAADVNRQASLQLIDLSRRHAIGRFVFASTCSNYGRMLDPTGYVDEDSELRPVSLYAETKVEVEQALLADPSARGPAATVLRLATVFGLSPRMRFDLTVNEFTMELLTKRQLVVYGDQFWRPYIHVRDVARAMVTVLEADLLLVGGRVFNVGETAENYQKRQLVEMIRAQIAEPVEVRTVEKAEDPRDYRVSFARAREVLGFRVSRTVPDGIREILDALRQRVIVDCDRPEFRN